LDEKTEEIYHLTAPGRQGNGGQLFLSFLHSWISKIAMAEICLKAETGSVTGCEWLVACDCKEFGQAEEVEFWV
jgi:hypothetical protein